jgi:hypothetical protein
LIALGLFAVGLSVALPYLIRPALAWDYALRVVWAVLLLAPVGLLMGIPFPAGLRQFASGTPSQVGTAWAVNGAVSGVAGVAGALLMLDVGLSAVMAIGGLAYLAAWLALRKQISRAS